MGMSLSSGNFYPPGDFSTLGFSGSLNLLLLGSGEPAESERISSPSPSYSKFNMPCPQFFRFIVFLWNLQFRTIEKKHKPENTLLPNRYSFSV